MASRKAGENVDIVLPSRFASNPHFSLYDKNGIWYINDEKSKNGTILNNRRITFSRLSPFDVVTIHDISIEFHESDERLDSILRSSTSMVEIPDEGPLTQRVTSSVQNFVSALGGDARVPLEFEVFRNELLEVVNGFEKRFRVANRELEVILDITRAITEITDLKELLNVALRLVSELRHCERGIVLLFDRRRETFIPFVKHRMTAEGLSGQDRDVSRSILGHLYKTREAILVENTLRDSRFASAESVVALKGKSLLCVPLVSKHGLQGAFYLEKDPERPFTHEDKEFMVSFAGSVAVGIDNTRLINAIKKEKQLRGNMERFISPHVVEELSKRPGGLELAGEKREITILFADIKNFTPMSEKLPVETVFATLNRIFTGCTEIIFNHDGTLDKFMGDCVMAFFGAPVAHEDDALRAVNCAREIIRLIEMIDEDFQKEHGIALGFSIGINTGQAIVGNMGSPERMEYTAIGDTINLGARLQSKAGFNEIVIHETVRQKLSMDFPCTEMEPFNVKGKAQPIKAYKVGAGQ